MRKARGKMSTSGERCRLGATLTLSLLCEKAAPPRCRPSVVDTLTVDVGRYHLGFVYLSPIDGEDVLI